MSTSTSQKDGWERLKQVQEKTRRQVGRASTSRDTRVSWWVGFFGFLTILLGAAAAGMVGWIWGASEFPWAWLGLALGCFANAVLCFAVREILIRLKEIVEKLDSGSKNN